jgi:murein DD-endopeptidase MepM/ murein hydrolase activator NlpD
LSNVLFVRAQELAQQSTGDVSLLDLKLCRIPERRVFGVLTTKGAAPVPNVSQERKGDNLMNVFKTSHPTGGGHTVAEYVQRFAVAVLAVILGSAGAEAQTAPARPSIPQLSHPTGGVGNVIGPFGAQWIEKGCDGQWKRHTGVDIGGKAVAGTPVYAVYDGVVKIKFTDKKWKGCLVIEHSDARGVPFTSTYWHVDYPAKLGSKVKQGQQIGTIADLGGVSTIPRAVANERFTCFRLSAIVRRAARRAVSGFVRLQGGKSWGGSESH